MATTAELSQLPRPWLTSYPEGIAWDASIDTSPVHEQVLAVCTRVPDAHALDFFGAKTTFGALGRAIEALAGALQRRYGVKKGVRVALMLPNTPFYVIAYYAILRAGGTVVNCNPLYSVHELTHIVGNADAGVLITLDLAQMFPKAEALVEAGHIKAVIVCDFASALPPLKALAFRLFKRADLADVRGSRIAASVTLYPTLITQGDAPTPVAIDAQADIAVQQYTGGTTGLPRGAMLTHANIAANVSQIDKWGYDLFYPPSRIIAVLPFFHIFAMTTCMNAPLCNGAQVFMLPRFELKALLDLLTRSHANVLLAVPTLLRAIARPGARQSQALADLKVVISGGSALGDEVRTRFASLSSALLAEGYGLTEASPVVCCAALRVPSKPGSIGLPLPGTDLRFIDVDTGQPVPVGAHGELQVKGPQVMAGYFNDPQASADAFMDGWLRSGDIGYMDADGYVFLVDRLKDLIISSGFNVYPRVIEDALMAHPAVEECSVIGVPDEYRGEAPVAYITLRPGMSETAPALKAFLGEQLSKTEMPREIIFRDTLPKTLIGKPSKKDLRTLYEAERAAAKPSNATPSAQPAP